MDAFSNEAASDEEVDMAMNMELQRQVGRGIDRASQEGHRDVTELRR